MSGGRQMLKERYNAGRREKVHEDVKRRQAAKAVTCLLYFCLKKSVQLYFYKSADLMRSSCGPSCGSVLLHINEYVVVVNDSVHGCGHDKSGKHIKDGMLL